MTLATITVHLDVQPNASETPEGLLAYAEEVIFDITQQYGDVISTSATFDADTTATVLFDQDAVSA